MTLNEAKTEVEKIIADLKSEIREEETAGNKTANYKQCKERLTDAEELRAELEKKTQSDFDSVLFDFELENLTSPMY